jgi:hypothetical protein
MFVAVMLDEANARRFDGEVPDLEGAAEVVSRAAAGPLGLGPGGERGRIRLAAQ